MYILLNSKTIHLNKFCSLWTFFQSETCNYKYNVSLELHRERLHENKANSEEN